MAKEYEVTAEVVLHVEAQNFNDAAQIAEEILLGRRDLADSETDSCQGVDVSQVVKL